jgi:hypothetical protein
VRIAAALLLLVAVPVALAGPGTVETLRRDVQRALKLRTPGEQATAMGQAFSGQDSPEAAQVAVDQVLDQDEPQLVLDAAMNAVARMQKPAVVDVLRKAADSGPQLRRLRAIEAMGRSAVTSASGAIVPLTGDTDAAIRAAAVTALGRRDESVVEGVEAALADKEWTVRSAAVSSLSRLGAKRSVPALCTAMRAETGRLVDDCTVALRTITGQRFGADPARYLAWWAGQEKKEAAPPPAWTAPPLSFESLILGTRSKRILFILSTSDTMKDPVSGAAADEKIVASVAAAGSDLADDLKAAKTKLDVARVHLRAMLRTLKDGVDFDVMVYSGSPSYAFGKLTVADASSRKRAEGRIASLSPGGYGNLHGALVRAFGKDPYAGEDGPDTIVLFTDGALAEPGSKDPTEVAASALRWNAVRQIRFLVVATGQAEDAVLGRLAAGPPEGGSASVP